MLVYTNPSVRNGATTLTVNQMPSHTHGIGSRYATYSSVQGEVYGVSSTTSVVSSATGGSQAHAHSISAT